MTGRARTRAEPKPAAADAGSRPDPRLWLSSAALELYDHLDALGEIERLKQMPRYAPVDPLQPQVKPTPTWWEFVQTMLRLAALARSRQ
jgi:hypothetical protein